MLVLDFTHRFFYATHQVGVFRIAAVSPDIANEIVDCFAIGRTCLIRHANTAYRAMAIEENMAGVFNLTVAECKLEVVS